MGIEGRLEERENLVDNKRENNDDAGDDTGADGKVKELKRRGEDDIDALEFIGAKEKRDDSFVADEANDGGDEEDSGGKE